ncbi:MAG: Ig-like domain-containing protein [Bifidobacterium psychraerophilum]|uniref:Ig-like domain-containing protein n=1 Tax=Bifidobacterium psychraerophilum TaxID=218140 RepID=UPI0039E78F22
MTSIKKLLTCVTAFAALGTGLASSTVASAEPQTEDSSISPIASFDFNTPAVDKAYAYDGAKASIKGTETLVSGAEGEGTAAQLGSAFWLDVTKNDGSPLLAGMDDVTFSFDSKTQQSFGAWALFAAPTNAQVEGNAPTYVGVLDHTDKIRVERYLSGRAGDAATIEAGVTTGTSWKHVDVVVSGKTSTVYVDRKFVARNTSGNTLSEILGDSGGVLQFGKGNWGSGEYYSGLLDNLKIYDAALSGTQLGITQPTSLSIQGTGVKDGALTVKEGSSAKLSATISPSGADPELTWESNNPAVASVSASGLVTASMAGTATISARSQRDPSISTSLKVTVDAVDGDDAYGYIMVHFMEDSNGYAEKIYFDISRGDNAEQWDPLNAGEPVLANNLSTTGVRDPFIAYNPENATYYVLATDLRVFGGDNANWYAWVNDYSTKFHVWQTKDFISFSDMSTLETTADSSGTRSSTLTDTVTGDAISQIGMAWAPEATWVADFCDLNDDGVDNASCEGGAFVMYWSVEAQVGDAPRGKNVLWAATTDFSQDSFEFGGVLVPTTSYTTTIDTTIIQRERADGGLRTYRVTGSGNIYMQVTDRQDWWRAANNVDWRTTQQGIGSAYGSVEGAASFKVNGEDKWYLYVDDFPTPGYRPMVASDLDAEDAWQYLDSSDFVLRSGTKHGGIVPLTKSGYDAIRAADASPSQNADLNVKETVKVPRGASAEQLVSALPKTQQVSLNHDFGTADSEVSWDVSGVDTSRDGRYTVSGTVRSIGANLNHWSWTDSTGRSRSDTELLINSGANAANSWSLSGGFAAQATDRPLYSSTAITVSAEVVVSQDDGAGTDDGDNDGDDDGGNNGGNDGSGSEDPDATGESKQTEGDAAGSGKDTRSVISDKTLASTGAASGPPIRTAALLLLAAAVSLMLRHLVKHRRTSPPSSSEQQ